MLKKYNKVIIAFAIILLFWIILFFFRENLEPWFDIYFGKGFIISYLASLLEDIIFFGLIGFTALVISTKLLEDEKFEIRINSLANNKMVGEKPKIFLKSIVTKNLAYNSVTNVNLQIKEFNREKNCIKLYSNFEGELVNMCKDIQYPLLHMNFTIEPNEQINGSYGYISYLGIFDKKLRTKEVLIDKDVVDLKDNKIFKKNFNFTISEDSSGIWQMSFATWGKINLDRSQKENWFAAGSKGFTESFTVRILNDSGESFKCDVQYISRDENNYGEIYELKGIELNSDSKELTLGNNMLFHPEDKFEIYFYK